MMRLSQFKLLGLGMVSLGLITFAGFGAFTALAQRPEGAWTEPTTAPAPAGQPPAIVPSGDSITAYPDLDPKGLEDLVMNCPKLLGGKDVSLGANDPALLQLQKARLNAALAQSALVMDRVKAGQLNDALALPEVCNRAASAAADVFAANEARPWFEERVRVAKWYETVIGAQVKGGKKGAADLNAARYARLEAEIALMKLSAPKAAAGR